MPEYNAENFESTTSTGVTGETSGETASRYASKAREGMNQAVETGKRRLEDARHSTASGLERVASWAHDSASHVPGGEKAQRAAHAVADGMNRSATYLREHNFRGMASDVEGYVRKHPGASLAVAAALGFLLVTSIRRSRSR